jgi:predicted DNA-binding protein (MmcQ/YjbR family)
MRSHQNAPEEFLTKLRDFCTGFPQVEEERAWVGTRWCVRKKSFAHVLSIADGWPPAYVRASGSAGPATVLTFRANEQEHHALRGVGHPFFVPVWWPSIAGVFVNETTDWDELFELVAESYRLLAPKKLAEQVTGRR